MLSVRLGGAEQVHSGFMDFYLTPSLSREGERERERERDRERERERASERASKQKQRGLILSEFTQLLH